MPSAGFTSTSMDGCDALNFPAPEQGQGVQFSIELPLEAGEERQVCKLVRLDHDVNMNWADGVYTQGSHHGLTARTMYHGDFPTENIRGERVDASQVATCESLGSDWDALSVIAGGRGEQEDPHAKTTTFKGAMPDDVAFKLAAGDVLLMNFHMINTTDHAIRACYKQNLNGIPDEQVTREAGSIFWYNSYVTVPARGHASAAMACPITQDVELGAQVSHMHKRGVGYSAVLLDGDPLSNPNEVMRLYEFSDWQEPITRVDTPALQLQQGQWIRWQCDYTNTEDRNVAQGQWTSDEMCMFLGVYWPRSDQMDWCAAPGSSDSYSAARPITTGTMNGSQFVDCWKASPQTVGGGGPDSNAARYASQRCITDSCANVSQRLPEISAHELDPTTLGCD